jgi:hypothetical protein
VATLIKKNAAKKTVAKKAPVKLVKKADAVKAVAVAAKTTEKAVAEKLVNPFSRNPLSRGFWVNGGKRPVVTFTEAITDAVSLSGEATKFAKGDSGRFLRLLSSDVALVLPGLSGCKNDEGRDTVYDFTVDGVEVPVSALR